MGVIKVGMLGLGTVGSGVYQLFQKNQASYQRELDCQINIVKIAVAHPEKERKVQLPVGILTGNAAEIIKDPEIQVVIELIGGGKGFDSDLAILREKKHLVTADKLLIATQGDELFRVAAENNVNLMFGASVGGGIPVVRWLKDGLKADKIKRLMAIANGTTNFMLAAIAVLSYDTALSLAINKGYAEPNPSFDVEGLDAAYKLAILARLAFRRQINFNHIYPVEGITALEPADFTYANRWGYVIKLIAGAEDRDGKLDLRVHPMLIPEEHPLAQIVGVNNGFYVEGEAIGEQTLGPGLGAGPEPTASTVIADLLQVCQDIEKGQVSSYPINSLGKVETYPITQVVNRYYLRLALTNEAGALAEVTNILKDFGISVSALDQAETTEPVAEVAILTWPTEELNIYKAIARFQESPAVKKVCPPIRILPRKERQKDRIINDL